MNEDNERSAKEARKKYGQDIEIRTHEVRASGDEMVIEGYAAVFNQETDIGPFREIIDPNAFDGRLDDDVRLLLNHDGAPMARTTNGTLELSTDDHGLHYRAQLVDTQLSRDLYAMIKRGDISQSSFAFTIQDEERDTNGARRIKRVGSILDVSPTTYPAYPTSTVSARKKYGRQDEEKRTQPEETKQMNLELTIKDLLSVREDYMQQRQKIKDVALSENRDMTDVDVRELERLADEVAKCDRQIKVKREDEKLAQSAILAGGHSASRSEERELQNIGQNFSLIRGLQQVYRNKPLTGAEAEMTEEATREASASGIQFRGQLSIPQKFLRAVEHRAVGDSGELATSGTGGGGNMIPTNIAPAIEALRAQTVAEQLGTTVLTGLTGTTKIPRISGTTIADKGEGVAAATSLQTLGATTLSPRRATAFTTITEQLLLQGGQGIEALITRDLGTAVAAHIDNDFFSKVIAALVVDVAASGPSTVVEDAVNENLLSAMEASCFANGVNGSDIRVVANASGHGALSGEVNVTGVSALMNRENMTVLGYPYYIAGNMANAATGANNKTILVGDWSKGAVLGLFGGVDVVINPYALDLENQIRVSIHRHYDCDLMTPGAIHARWDNGA